MRVVVVYVDVDNENADQAPRTSRFCSIATENRCSNMLSRREDAGGVR